jgi:hypothetical protein
MGEMDQGLKRLLQIAPEVLIPFLVQGCQYLESLTTDVAVEAQLVLDTLFRVLYQGIECLLNIEIQSSADADMARRCFDYAKRASFLYKVPVMSIVLWLRKRGTLPATTYEERVGDRLLGTWNIFSVEIYNLQARDMINTGIVGLLPLVPFMQGADLATIEEAAQVVEAQAPEELQATFTTLLAVFTAQFHGKDAARALVRRLKMATNILEESPLYREWVDTAKAEGKIEGKAEGKIEGKAEGEHEGLAMAVKLVLEGRFGGITEDLATAIQAAEVGTLRDALLHAGTDNLDALRVRFGLHA